MKRRVALLLALTAAGGAAAVWTPARVAANTGLCPQPAVSGVSPQVAAPGATVTITGSGFQGLACPVTVMVGGVSGGKVTGVSSAAVTFTAGSGLHGGVQVVLTDSLNASNTSNGNITFFNPVSASGVSPAAPTAGQGVTVGGQGFSLGLPAGDEHLAAAYLWGDGSTCAGASAAVASNTAVSVSAPGHYCDGPVSLAIGAPADLDNPTVSPLTLYSGTPGSVDVAASGAQLSSPAATAGGTVGVSGSGFGSAGTATIGGATVPSTWTDSSVSLSVPDTAVSNSPVSLTRATDGAVIGAGTLGVVARVDGVSPSSASSGATVTISGGGFGVHPGTVTLGSTSMAVSSWSPTSIAVTVPSGAQTGAMTITPVDTSPPASQPSLTVVQHIAIQPTTGGAPGAGSTGSHGSTSNAAPLTPQQVQQVTAALSAPPPPAPATVIGGPAPSMPPSHPTNGPISLSLHTSSATGKPGKTVPFTVTLRAYGKPVGNAPVQMVIAYEPGSDGSISPATGVTNASGQLSGVVHLSKTPGEMLILARSGMFSDEVRLVGSTATAATLSGTPGGAGSAVLHALPIAVIVLAALLLAAGIGLRIALAMGAGDGLRAALLRERISAALRMTWLRRRSRAWRASWHQVQSGGDAPGELEVPAEDQPSLGLRVLDGDTAPEQAKEGVEVGA